MIWRNDISDLDFYNNKGGPCYCEQLAYPSDLILQGVLPSSASSGFVMRIWVMSADGLTEYEVATSYFDHYFFIYNGVRYFNLKLKSYSPAMCTYKCWILKVRVIDANGQIIFLKYTEKYCQTTCCDVPRGITASVDDTIDITEQSTTVVIPMADCNLPLIRIRSRFDCVDNYNNDFYGTPTQIISGTASFTFEKITNIVARFIERPRDIVTEISFNCNLQRTESAKPWLLDSFSYKGIFPYWKLDELEVMLHANNIYVSDFITENQYRFLGGVIGEDFGLKCWRKFKLKATLHECTIRQLYGCSENCEPSLSRSFLVSTNPSGSYYTENNVFVGNYDDLLNWYRNQTGVTSVTDTTGTYDNTEHSFVVDGTGYIPTYFFAGFPVPSNKVYGTNNPVAPVVVCATPVIGVITCVDEVCATPAIGTITCIDVPEEDAAVNDFGDWDVDEGVSRAILSGGYGQLSITTFNPLLVASSSSITNWQNIIADQLGADITVPAGDCMQLTYGSSTYLRTTDFTQAGNVVTMTNGVTFAIGDDVAVGMQITSAVNPFLSSEVIGVISVNGWPTTPYEVTTADYTLRIDINGNIYYSGYPTTTDMSGSEIVITNLYYPL